MRLSSAQLNNIMQSSMETSTAGFNRTIEQMGAHKRILEPSDDPLGSVQVMMLKREQANIDQFQKNITNLSAQLGQTESELDSSNNGLLRAQELVTGVLNASNSSEGGRKAIATELQGILDQMVNTANSKNPNGDYIFSGTQTSTKPVALDASGKYVYQGNDEQRMVSVDESMTVPSNQTANAIYFGGKADGSDIFNTLAGVIKDLRDPDVSGQALVQSVTDAQVNLKGTLGDMTEVLTDIGGQRASLDRVTGAHEDNKLINKGLISDVEDLDYSDAILKMNTEMAALQATQMSYTKIQSLSLFKMM